MNMQRFIRVCTVWKGKINLYGYKIHHSLKILTCDPLEYIMDNPILIVWVNPLVYKGLKHAIWSSFKMNSNHAKVM